MSKEFTTGTHEEPEQKPRLTRRRLLGLGAAAVGLGSVVAIGEIDSNNRNRQTETANPPTPANSPRQGYPEKENGLPDATPVLKE